VKSIKDCSPALFLLSVLSSYGANTLGSGTNGVNQAGGMFYGLAEVSRLFSGRFAGIIGTIALVVGVVSYLVSTSTDLSPVLRLLIKIVMCLSLMVGGSTMLSSVVTQLATSVI